jgi:hypothetical protein
MRVLSLKGILLGGIADIVATNIAAFPLIIVAATRVNTAGLPKAEQSKALVTAMQASFGLQVSGWILGGLCSVLGGYIAARLAKRGEVVNGALSAYLCVGLGIYSWVSGSAPVPAWQHLVAFVGSPALGALGGYLRLRQTRSTDDRPLTAPLPA